MLFRLHIYGKQKKENPDISQILSIAQLVLIVCKCVSNAYSAHLDLRPMITTCRHTNNHWSSHGLEVEIDFIFIVECQLIFGLQIFVICLLPPPHNVIRISFVMFFLNNGWRFEFGLGYTS
jgi:hypothetical protein